MPWTKIWIHLVWSTKNHEPFLSDSIRQKVFQHIRENARAKGIYIDYINGYLDHVHCLISLGTDQTIEKIMQLLKGESSFWINKNKICKFKFAWQEEYFAASVSPSGIPAVRRYIANQEEHHRKQTFRAELDGFMVRAGFKQFDDVAG
jgi:REP element-mobilizing transposase RayT